MFFISCKPFTIPFILNPIFWKSFSLLKYTFTLFAGRFKSVEEIGLIRFLFKPKISAVTSDHSYLFT